MTTYTAEQIERVAVALHESIEKRTYPHSVPRHWDDIGALSRHNLREDAEAALAALTAKDSAT